jgi:hypothetical protein
MRVLVDSPQPVEDTTARIRAHPATAGKHGDHIDGELCRWLVAEMVS